MHERFTLRTLITIGVAVAESLLSQIPEKDTTQVPAVPDKDKTHVPTTPDKTHIPSRKTRIKTHVLTPDKAKTHVLTPDKAKTHVLTSALLNGRKGFFRLILNRSL